MTAAEAPTEAPLPMTGDRDTDDELVLLRKATEAIHEAMDEIAAQSVERHRLVLSLRRRKVKFSVIADAAQSTEQTIYKVHREAKRVEHHDRGDHSLCDARNCPVVAEEEEQSA